MQLLRIVLGYGAAALTGMALVTALMFYTLRFFGEGEYGFWDYLNAGYRTSLQGVLFTLAPAMLLIALAEIYRWRNLLIYEAMGALLPLPLVYSFDAGFIAESAAIGAASGFAYWLVAGRRAGEGGAR
jgi:hypothetical protein